MAATGIASAQAEPALAHWMASTKPTAHKAYRTMIAQNGATSPDAA